MSEEDKTLDDYVQSYALMNDSVIMFDIYQKRICEFLLNQPVGNVTYGKVLKLLERLNEVDYEVYKICTAIQEEEYLD